MCIRDSSLPSPSGASAAGEQGWPLRPRAYPPTRIILCDVRCDIQPEYSNSVSAYAMFGTDTAYPFTPCPVLMSAYQIMNPGNSVAYRLLVCMPGTDTACHVWSALDQHCYTHHRHWPGPASRDPPRSS
eukprot:733921-Rhodomonas_salina.1